MTDLFWTKMLIAFVALLAALTVSCYISYAPERNGLCNTFVPYVPGDHDGNWQWKKCVSVEISDEGFPTKK